MATMEEVQRANERWFDSGKMEFFGDKGYELLHYNNEVFLLQETSMWSDMFGGKKTYVFRLHFIDPETLKIGDLVDEIFPTRQDAAEWIYIRPKARRKKA